MFYYDPETICGNQDDILWTALPHVAMYSPAKPSWSACLPSGPRSLWASLMFFLRSLPQVATLMFICSGLGIFPCCLKILRCLRNLGFLVIKGFRNFIFKPQ